MKCFSLEKFSENVRKNGKIYFERKNTSLFVWTVIINVQVPYNFKGELFKGKSKTVICPNFFDGNIQFKKRFDRQESDTVFFDLIIVIIKKKDNCHRASLKLH